MSLGNDYSNNGKKQEYYSPTVYSPYRFNNAESKVDKTCLTFSFWKNALRVTIAPKKETGNDEVSFDMDNGIVIYLNHTKARIFADILRKFKENPAEMNGAGVSSGSGLITISSGIEYNSDAPIIIIRKIDDHGQVSSSFAYEFKTNYHFGIKNYDENGGSFDRIYYNDLELDQFICILEEYYRATTSAIAYTVIDQMKYNDTRVANKLKAIAEKLGIESSSGGSGRSYSSQSYFNKSSGEGNTSSGSYTSSSIDDID